MREHLQKSFRIRKAHWRSACTRLSNSSKPVLYSISPMLASKGFLKSVLSKRNSSNLPSFKDGSSCEPSSNPIAFLTSSHLSNSLAVSCGKLRALQAPDRIWRSEALHIRSHSMRLSTKKYITSPKKYITKIVLLAIILGHCLDSRLDRITFSQAIVLIKAWAGCGKRCFMSHKRESEFEILSRNDCRACLIPCRWRKVWPSWLHIIILFHVENARHEAQVSDEVDQNTFCDVEGCQHCRCTWELHLTLNVSKT